MERYITISPAHDCHDSCDFDDPKCNRGEDGWHGISSCNIRFVVRGPEGGISFYLLTEWFRPETVQRLREQVREQDRSHFFADGLGGVDYHSKVATEYGYHRGDCDVTGGDCWSGRSAPAAQDAYAVLTKGGDGPLWDWLEERYRLWLVERED